MDTPSLQQLAACIQSALEQHQFASPKTPDTSVTDAYADAATSAVMGHLLASGWLLAKLPGDWPPSVEMGAEQLKEILRGSIRFPLLMAKKPPRRRGEAEMADHHRAVAESVASHLVQRGWSLAPALAKKPPAPLPSSSRYMGGKD